MTEKLRLSSRQHWIVFLFTTLVTGLFSFPTYGQKTIFKSSNDDSMTIKSITVAPMVDNVSDIYAKPLTTQLRSIVENDRQWSARSYPENYKSSVEEFEDKPETVKTVLKKANADALLTTRLIKGPNGISIKMNLFLASDGLLLAQETLQDYSGFEISELRSQLESLYGQLKSHMPYAGILLSRKGNQITVNLGTQQGLRDGNEISVIQILKVNRHPRFHFVVSAEKEIIGRIHIDKAEESLSFGSIVLERSENVVQPGMKVIPIDFVTYAPNVKAGDGKTLNDLASRPDSQLALGEHPREWVPASTPSLGKISMMLGLGSYAVNNTTKSAGAVNSSQTPTPSIHLDGELWLTTNWFMGLDLKQYILTLNNSYPGSGPGTIGVSSTQTTLQVGYNFLMQDEFFGPKFQLLGGYSKFASTVDTSSPTAYTSLSFSGLALGIAGSIPVSQEMPITVGAKLLYYLNSSVEESPVSSGRSSSAKMTSFSTFGTYRWTEHMNIRGELMYDLFSASFSGSGSRLGQNGSTTDTASSASHTLTTFAGGIEYLF